MITREEGQKIANRLINILEKNINIIDLSGKVIASTDEKRIGTFHEAAKISVQRKENIIINESNIHLFKGSREGINLPIFIEGEIIGVVGITGKVDEVKGYGIIVKELVELMITENRIQSEKQLHEDAERNFIINLINKDDNKNLSFLINRSKEIGFNEYISRRLILVEIKDYAFLVGNYNKTGNLTIQENIKKIKDIIKRLSLEEIIVIELYDGKLLIVKEDNKDVIRYIHIICEELKKKYNIKLRFIISDSCNKLLDYSREFEKCNRVLSINSIRNERIIFTENYALNILLEQIPKKQKNEYLIYYKDIFNNIPEKKIRDIFETIKLYFESNMNIGIVAKKLYLHRNTIANRIKEFKELTGINITDSFECMKIYIAIYLYELED